MILDWLTKLFKPRTITQIYNSVASAVLPVMTDITSVVDVRLLSPIFNAVSIPRIDLGSLYNPDSLTSVLDIIRNPLGMVGKVIWQIKQQEFRQRFL